MSQPYIGEIRLFAGNFAPLDFAFCNGALLPIADYSALFNLIGTTYGGDGQNTFALPNLLSRFPVHQGTLQGGSTYIIGQLAGAESVTLITSNLPAHTHTVNVAAVGGSDTPNGNYWGASTGKPYGVAPGSLSMNPGSLQSVGGNQPHDNMIPFQVTNYIIALYGIYPSQN
jgi:microcystin-dependent protein